MQPGHDESELLRLCGDRGLMRLERYRVTGDAADLNAAIEDLARATEAVGEQDWPLWCFELSWALLQRLDEHSSDADSVQAGEAALSWLIKARIRSHPDLDPDELALEIADLAWSIYATRQDPGQIDELVERLRALRAESSLARAVMAALLGAALEERFQIAKDSGVPTSGDIDEAIGLLGPALEELPDEFEPLGGCYQSLFRAYAARFERDRDRSSVDEMVEVSLRASRRVPSESGDWLALRTQHVVALSDRFDLVGDHGDRDRLIEQAAQVVTHADADPMVAWTLGSALRERGNDYRRPADLAAAARWFADAGRAWPGDDAEMKAYCWLDAASAHWDHRGIAGGTEDLAPLLAALDAAEGLFALFAVPSDQVVGTQMLRLQAHRALTDHMVAAGASRAVTARGTRDVALRAHAALRACLDADPLLQSMTALLAVFALLEAAGREEKMPDIRGVRDLIGIARRNAPDAPEFQQLLGVAQGFLGLLEDAYENGGRGDFGVEQLWAALEDHPGSPREEALRELLDNVKSMRDTLGGRRDGRGPAHGPRPEDAASALDCLAPMAAARQRGDMPTAVSWARRGLELLGDGPDAEANTAMVRSMFAIIVATSDLEKGALGAPLPEVPSMGPDVMNSFLAPALRITTLGITVVQRARAGDHRGAEQARDELIRTVDGTADFPWATSLPTHLAAVTAAATALEASPHDHTLAERAAGWGERATAGIDAGHPVWPELAGALARIHYDYRHDHEAGRRWGLDALRGHAWNVLLQSDVDAALLAAAKAIPDAFRVAGWCVQDAWRTVGPVRQRALAEAVRALDAGRALTLNAATATTRVYDALALLGEAELAKDWLVRAQPRVGAAVGLVDPGDALRDRVVRTLAASGAVAGLLDPPGVDEIAAALVAAGQQAMVYLVGGPGAFDGFGLLVFASGEVRHIELPGLVDSGPLVGYLELHHVSGDEAHPLFGAWRESLDAICDWAFTAALRDILAEVSVPAPRLVLVPAGPLGIVPWHAARRAVDGVWRYAVSDVEISIAPSARLWCDAALRPSATRGTALVLGDPAGDLPSARSEAAAIHQAFYPDAVHMGRGAPAAGTVGDLSAWLTADGGAPCAVLHTACHALVDAGAPTRSHLRLADGNLSVADLLLNLRQGSRGLGTVVLAACTTSVTGTAYDEALSLSTAFLVGGARSVVGSLWSVPSTSTALLMFMFHYYLRDDPDQPARALRMAQLWMLDPARSCPAELPTALYAGHITDRLTDPYRWAGFSHLGR